MTAIPAVLAALTQLTLDSPDLTDVVVSNGPLFNRQTDALDIIVFGSLPVPARPSIALTETPAGMGSTSDSFDVQGYISSWSGDDDLSIPLARADALFDVVRSVVLTTPTLGLPGVVSWSNVIAANYSQNYSTDENQAVLTGSEVIIGFVIRVQTFTTP